MESGRYFEDGFEDFLDGITKRGTLCDEPVFEGVARACKDKGYDKLTNKQQTAIDTMMSKYFNDGVCEACCCPISWCEMENSMDNGRRCSGYQHTWENLEKE